MTAFAFCIRLCKIFPRSAGVAQLVERNLAKVEVASSRLVSRSRIPDVTMRGRLMIAGLFPFWNPENFFPVSSPACINRFPIGFYPLLKEPIPATLRVVMHLSLSGAKVIFTASFSL